MKESDLYPGLKQFLELQGYTVKAEVHDCDVVAMRGEEEPVIVELKRSFTLSVVLQAIDRLSLSERVYIGIPENSKNFKLKQKRFIKLLRMLGIGLVVINLDRENHNVNIILDPGGYRPRKSKLRKERLLGEFIKRVGDPNLGGSAKRKGIMTAYRQRVIKIACYLRENGSSKASRVAEILNEPKSRDILYKDVYGWFDRVSRGEYELSPRGSREINSWLNDGRDES